jgi:hypothetical protein
VKGRMCDFLCVHVCLEREGVWERGFGDKNSPRYWPSERGGRRNVVAQVNVVVDQMNTTSKSGHLAARAQ